MAMLVICSIGVGIFIAIFNRSLEDGITLAGFSIGVGAIMIALGF